MKSAGKILGYIMLIALVLVIGYGALRALPQLLPDSSTDSAGSDTGSADSSAGGGSSVGSAGEEAFIDEETFEILGAASTFTDLTNLRLRFGAAVSAAAYEGMQDDPELEIGLITISAESCPETLTVTIGGDLQSAVGSSQMECFTEERLFIDEILEYGGESARVLEYDVDGGYYILVVPTGGAFYESEGAIEVTSDRGGLLE